MKLHRDLHYIQRHIIKVLGSTEWARYRDMRLEGLESSLYNYHLREVMKTGLVEKVPGKGYRLTLEGLRYVDHVSIRSFEPRWQPKLINVFIISNEKNELLMYKKMRQPFVHQWNLPSGKLHFEDASVVDGARRELEMILGDSSAESKLCGVLDATIEFDGVSVSHAIYFVHRLLGAPESVSIDQAYTWHAFASLADEPLAPHVHEVLKLSAADERFAYHNTVIQTTRN